jgi:hypothetical protein
MQEYRIHHPDYFKNKGKEKYARIEDKMGYNKQRYADSREQYISRRRAYLKTTNGRFTQLLHSARTRAKTKGLDYNLTLEWLLDTYEKQNHVCLLTGLPFDFSHNLSLARSFAPFSPSLDRIDPKKGYTIDNVRLVVTAINLALNNFGEDTFTKVAQAYLNCRHSITAKSPLTRSLLGGIPTTRPFPEPRPEPSY